jgi:ribosomal protein L14
VSTKQNKKMLRKTYLNFNTAAVTAAASAAGADAAASGERQSTCWYRWDMMIRRTGSWRNWWGTGIESPKTGVPLQDKAMLHCVDNTAAKHLRAISQTSERISAHRVLPVVVHRTTIQRYKNKQFSLKRQKMKPGEVHWAVLFTRRQYNCRNSGLITTFDKNSAVLINDKKVPLGSRVMYCAGRHVNNRAHLKAAVLANFFL